jgi:hypothetical protein
MCMLLRKVNVLLRTSAILFYVLPFPRPDVATLRAFLSNSKCIKESDAILRPATAPKESNS